MKEITYCRRCDGEREIVKETIDEETTWLCAGCGYRVNTKWELPDGADAACTAGNNGDPCNGPDCDRCKVREE